eukprot:COSAG02_NODE_424_length_22575_cov_79.088361_14_plen_48_part_00
MVEALEVEEVAQSHHEALPWLGLWQMASHLGLVDLLRVTRQRHLEPP